MKKLSILFVPTLLFVSACTSKSSTAKDSNPTETSVAAADSAPVESNAVAGDSTVESLVVAETSAPDSSPVPGDSVDSTVVTATSPATDDSSASASAVPTTGPDSAPTQAVSQVLVQPGQSTDKFVGAASDVTTDTCKQEGGSWKISGKVKNSSGSKADYRIYVALNRKGSTDTRGLLQVNKTVEDGKSEEWSTSAVLGDDDLICILRVERIAAK